MFQKSSSVPHYLTSHETVLYPSKHQKHSQSMKDPQYRPLQIERKPASLFHLEILATELYSLLLT